MVKSGYRQGFGSGSGAFVWIRIRTQTKNKEIIIKERERETGRESVCVYILYCSWLKLIDIDKFLIFLAGWLESLSRLTSNINCNGKEKEKMEK